MRSQSNETRCWPYVFFCQFDAFASNDGQGSVAMLEGVTVSGGDVVGALFLYVILGVFVGSHSDALVEEAKKTPSFGMSNICGGRRSGGVIWEGKPRDPNIGTKTGTWQT